MGFAEDIAKFRKKAVTRMVKVTKSSALEMFTRIVRLTPVDTGRARANWQIDLDGINQNASIMFNGEQAVKGGDDEVRRQRNGAKAANEAISKGKKVIQAVNPRTKKIILFNNLEYIVPLEYGHSEQAKNPDGMVRLTAAQWSGIVNAFAGTR